MKKIDPIAKQSSIVEKMAQSWPLIKTLIGGTGAIREAGREYLPQWPNESNDSYNNRLNTATLHPAFKRTVKVLASKPFSKNIKYNDDIPERIKVWLDDVDLQGNNLHAFISSLFEECIAYSVSGVLVDYPTVNNTSMKLADEKASGLRPYFVRYHPWNILGWRTERANGYDRLIQLRLREIKVIPDGEYGEKSVEQIRVLTPGAWELHQKNDKDEWFVIDSGVSTLKEIPFVMFYGNRTGFMTGEPPLLELAYQNVEHYQSCSDQQTILHVSRVPILTMIGANEDSDVTVGAASAVKLPIGSDMKFVEHSGAAISAGRQSIIDLEERMRQTGAELLLLKPGHVTATEIQSDDEGNKCDLQRATENAEDSINQCLQFMADWVGESTGGSVDLFKDFGAASLTDASAQLLLTMSTSGKLSDMTLISELKRRGILSPDLDFEAEKELLEQQGPPLGTVGLAA